MDYSLSLSFLLASLSAPQFHVVRVAEDPEKSERPETKTMNRIHGEEKFDEGREMPGKRGDDPRTRLTSFFR